MIQVHVANTVSTFNLGVRDVDLGSIKNSIEGVNYNPRRFTAATLRFSSGYCGVENGATALVFSSGQVVIISPSENISLALGHELVDLLVRDVGIETVTLCDFKVRNRVVVTQLPVSEIPQNFKEFSEAVMVDPSVIATYQGKLFPGLVIRAATSEKTSATVFKSGKVVVSGLVKLENAPRVISLVRNAVRKAARGSAVRDIVLDFNEALRCAAEGLLLK